MHTICEKIKIIAEIRKSVESTKKVWKLAKPLFESAANSSEIVEILPRVLPLWRFDKPSAADSGTCKRCSVAMCYFDLCELRRRNPFSYLFINTRKILVLTLYANMETWLSFGGELVLKSQWSDEVLKNISCVTIKCSNYIFFGQLSSWSLMVCAVQLWAIRKSAGVTGPHNGSALTYQKTRKVNWRWRASTGEKILCGL